MKQQQHSPVHDGLQPAAPHATTHTHISHLWEGATNERVWPGRRRGEGGTEGEGAPGVASRRHPVVEGGEAQKTARGELLLAVLRSSLSAIALSAYFEVYSKRYEINVNTQMIISINYGQSGTFNGAAHYKKYTINTIRDINTSFSSSGER